MRGEREDQAGPGAGRGHGGPGEQARHPRGAPADPPVRVRGLAGSGLTRRGSGRGRPAQRQTGRDRPAGSVQARAEGATGQPDAFAQADEPGAASGGPRCSRPGRGPGHPGRHLVGRRAHLDPHGRARGVPGGVGQRLLDHPVHRPVHQYRQGDGVTGPDQDGVHPGFPGPGHQVLGGLVRGPQRDRLPVGPQYSDRFGRLVGRAGRRLAEPGGLGTAVSGQFAREFQGARAQGQQAQLVPHGVVEFSGDPGALAQPGPLGDQSGLVLQDPRPLPARLLQGGGAAQVPPRQPGQRDREEHQCPAGDPHARGLVRPQQPSRPGGRVHGRRGARARRQAPGEQQRERQQQEQRRPRSGERGHRGRAGQGRRRAGSGECAYGGR